MSEIKIDVSGMDPPYPAKIINEHLKKLKEGDALVVVGDKPFKNMIPLLEKNGYGVELTGEGSLYLLKIEVKRESSVINLDEVDCTGEIDEYTNVGRLLKAYPEALDILIEAGFTPLKNPAMRHMASTVSLKTAAKIIHMGDEDLQKLIERLRKL